MTTHIPLIAITMGDPAGIGPEICLRLFRDGLLEREKGPTTSRPFIIGDIGVLKLSASRLKVPQKLKLIESPADILAMNDGSIPVLTVGDTLLDIQPGVVDARCGNAAFSYIHTAISLARAGEIDAMVTAPIHKEALAAAKIPFPGHTEILTTYGGAQKTAMMLANDVLRVVLVTIHCSLREAIERADYEAQISAIKLAHEGTKQFGIREPRIAVAGLNPHAGEGGLFGTEEREVISPAIAEMKSRGLDVSGPWPGDTVFMQAREGRFDVVVAQYHDQGLIPVKYMGLADGVNVTLGLPFTRTSPDHGTAFDIAGTGKADPSSLATAYHQAVVLSHARRLNAAEREG